MKWRKNKPMKKKITILLPAYNEEASFPLIEQGMSQVVAENPDYDWEFLLINDGSTDKTLQQMIRLHQNDARYNYIDLSRNYGKKMAMMAGFDYATGDALIIMDVDMQHLVSVIPEMLRHWEEGYDDVYAQRQVSKESWLKRKTSQWYYKLLQSLTHVPIQKDTGDFRLLDRSCVDALKQMRESGYRYLVGARRGHLKDIGDKLDKAGWEEVQKGISVKVVRADGEDGRPGGRGS